MTEPSDPTVKRLFALSGNRCAFPSCAQGIVDANGTVVGRICHIKAKSAGGPRYDPTQSDAERHAFANLVLMCANHHVTIDGDVATYSVEVLAAMKLERHAEAIPVPEPATGVVAQLLATMSASPGGSTFVASVNQQGGITAATVIVEAHAPEISSKELFRNRPTEDGYHTSFELKIESPYAASELYIEIHAATLVSMDLTPQRTGIAMFGHSGVRDGYRFTTLMQPYGTLHLNIVTRNPETLRVVCDLS